MQDGRLLVIRVAINIPNLPCLQCLCLSCKIWDGQWSVYDQDLITLIRACYTFDIHISHRMKPMPQSKKIGLQIFVGVILIVYRNLFTARFFD